MTNPTIINNPTINNPIIINPKLNNATTTTDDATAEIETVTRLLTHAHSWYTIAAHDKAADRGATLVAVDIAKAETYTHAAYVAAGDTRGPGLADSTLDLDAYVNRHLAHLYMT
ncbi:MAG: hypothetical protein GY929_27540 [Actinomycetia bacterium]|nr:hypothetical protein [Actinomycetes bacterium]